MENLNAEKVKKDLKELMFEAYASEGAHKPYLTMRDALALINSYEQRITELNVEINAVRGAGEAYKNEIFELETRLKECENGYEGTLFLDRCKLHDAEEGIDELKAQRDLLIAELEGAIEAYINLSCNSECAQLALVKELIDGIREALDKDCLVITDGTGLAGFAKFRVFEILEKVKKRYINKYTEREGKIGDTGT